MGTWATAPLAEPATKENLALADATLRQIVHVSLGGDTVRLRLSNAFGAEPLALHRAHLALAAPHGGIQPGSDRAVSFGGKTAVTIPAGKSVVSDPLSFPLAPQADVAISLYFEQVPATLTAHPGARTTSYLQPGDALTATALPEAQKFERWYFINALEVFTAASDAAALAILGDSITDGRGSTTNGNNRWPDEFVRRFQAQPNARPLGVLNLGIGANCLLRDGVGESALRRLDRDVFGQNGVRWLLVYHGINDIGTGRDARKTGAPHATAADLIAGYEQLIARAHAAGLRIIGATITPYAGADFYWDAAGEAIRQETNAWIRTAGRFDAVVDFDAAVRDAIEPARLAPEFDSGDHLHLSVAGLRRLAETVDLDFFVR
ncbi:MAG: GDSL family lipase [Opitutus sp.]|nr:GDSL family lipase [Opitutus sp.]